MRKFEHEGWVLEITTPTTIVVTKLGESREYDVRTIVEANHDEGVEDYVYLTHEDNSFTQVKFEDEDFLVIDLFDVDGEFIDSIGSHVFGEGVKMNKPTKERIKRFREDWGQSHEEICSCLGYDEEDSDDMIMGDDYFWDEAAELWCNKSASGLQGDDQEVADYLRAL